MALNTPYTYDDPESTLRVTDGELAVADDVNGVWLETNQKLSDISSDMIQVDTNASGAVKWASNDQGDLPDVLIPDTYSAKAYSEESEEWATSADGIIDLADGTTVTEKSAKTYAEEAKSSETAAANSANFKGLWSGLAGTLTIPSSVYHDSKYWNLLNDLADVTTSEPGVSGDWVTEDLSNTGEIFMWPKDTPPAYGLMCDGSTYDYDTYPDLGDLLGGSTGGTFETPLITFAKNSLGTNTNTTEAESIGTHGHGADAVTDHYHSCDPPNTNTSTIGNHTHSVGVEGYSSFASGSYTAANDVASQTGSAGAHSHSLNIAAFNSASAGGHTPVVQDHTGTNQPACTLINYCIRI